MIYPAGHPFWSILRLAVVLSALTAILWLTASHFDKTEITTIIGAFAAMAGSEGITNLIAGRAKSAEPNQEDRKG